MDAVEISTSNPSVWYAAAESIVYRSDDAGKNWRSFFMGTPGRAGGLPIDLQVDPRDPYRIFENAYGGGNILSVNGGETWVDASRGYSGANIATIEVLAGAGWRLFANQFRSDDGGDHWMGTITTTPISAIAAYLPADGSGERIMAAGSYGTIHHSSNAGRSWSSAQVVDTLGAPFAAFFALDPSNSLTFYLGFPAGGCNPTLGPPGACENPGKGLFHQGCAPVPFHPPQIEHHRRPRLIRAARGCR
jgi:hypothetical protein